MIIGFLVTSLTNSGKIIGGSKLLPFKNDGGQCVLEDLQCCRNVLVPFPRSVPRYNPVSELYGQFLRPHCLVFALTCTVNCGTFYIDRCVCLSKSCPINLIYHRWTPMKFRIIKDNQWKQDAPELNFKSHSKGSYVSKGM